MNTLGTALVGSSQLTRSAVSCGAFTLLACTGIAYALQQSQALSPLYLAKVAVFYLLGFALVFANLAAHLPLRCFGAANQVTLIRASLVALLLGLVGEVETVAVAWIATLSGLLAAVLDGLDGWLARHQRTVSAFGARFDMETDALLILAMSVLAWQFGKAGPWILLAGLMRYMFLVAGYAVDWLRHPLPASRRRQAVCVIQVVTLNLCIAPVVINPWCQAVAATGLLLLVWSFHTDILWLARQARSQGRR